MSDNWTIGNLRNQLAKYRERVRILERQTRRIYRARRMLRDIQGHEKLVKLIDNTLSGKDNDND